MLIKAIISVDRRSQYVLSYLLYDLLSVSSFHCNTLNSLSLRFSLCLLIIWTEFLLGGAGSLAVLAQYVMQCRLTSVLSKCKITIVPLSLSFEGGSSWWKTICCASILHCLARIWQPQYQSSSGYGCSSFSTL